MPTKISVRFMQACFALVFSGASIIAFALVEKSGRIGACGAFLLVAGFLAYLIAENDRYTRQSSEVYRSGRDSF